jgi:hypothetical protein
MSRDKASERSAWTYERDFEDRETGLMVRINSMTIGVGYDGVPHKKRYSYEVGMNADGIFTRYFRATTFSDRGKASMPGRVDGVMLSSLINAAEVWIIEQEQTRQDAISEIRQQRNQQ